MGTPIPCSAQEEHIFQSRHPAVPVPDITLPDFVLQDAELYADKVAFVDAATGKTYTYAEVVRDTRRFAKALRSLGLRKGHVVVVALPNVAEYGIVALGIMAAGGVFSGANPTAHESELKKQAEAADAKLIVTDDLNYGKVKGLGLPVIVLGEESISTAVNWNELLDAADRAGDKLSYEEVLQSDLCALPFSSGTTGMSKGVMLTHRNLVANLCSSLFGVGPEMVGQVATLGLIPFFHIYVVVMGRFELRTFLNALITQEVNFAPIVPPIILALVKNPIVEEFDLSKLKLKAIMTAAAPLAPELLTAFENKFPGVQVQEAYGLTEHSCITLTHGDPSKGHGIAKKNSVGFLLPNLKSNSSILKTVNLSPRTPLVKFLDFTNFPGYFNNKEETARTIDADGWLHTGDIGYIDNDGDIFIVDRIKELIKYKGFQVAPAELEAILLSHPSVEDAAVVPLPDEEAGEIPAACVVMSKFVASNVAHYKKVRVVQFVDSIPKSPSGKIMRRLLKEKMGSGSKASHFHK
ncbi:Ca4CL [Salix suchowensis]|nr:Ca4CL [Salix suchowensis]